MNFSRTWALTLRTVAALGVLGFAGPTLAAFDVIYPSGANATVDGAGAPVTGNFVNPGSSGNGGNGSVTLNNDVITGQPVVVTVAWSITDRSPQGSNDSAYPRTVKFTVTQPDGAALTISSIANCGVSGNGSTCSTPVSFTPMVADTYQITVNANDLSPGSGQIQGRNVAINVTAVEPVAEAVDTRLTVDQQCVILHQPSVNLTSTLIALTDPESPVEGADIAYSIDGEGVGSAETNAAGVATLAYNPSALNVGDHNLYGEFAGDTLYNASNDSDTLGVSYAFGGFRPPLNADGTSIFGGRVIPVKIMLTDFNGVPVTDAQPRVWLVSYGVNNIGEDVEAATSVSAADTGNIMRYDASEQQYIYNFDAMALQNGSYKVRVDLGDSDACNGYREVPFTVSRKGKK